MNFWILDQVVIIQDEDDFLLEVDQPGQEIFQDILCLILLMITGRKQG